MTDQVPPPPPAIPPETGTGEETENEVLRAARELRAQKEAATEAADKEAGTGKRAGWKTAAAAAGIGIGSAAVLAALLYTNRDKLR